MIIHYSILTLEIVIGTMLLLVGIAMIVLLGPASIVIPAGPAILGMKFIRAGRPLYRLEGKAKNLEKTLEHPVRQDQSSMGEDPDVMDKRGSHDE